MSIEHRPVKQPLAVQAREISTETMGHMARVLAATLTVLLVDEAWAISCPMERAIYSPIPSSRDTQGWRIEFHAAEPNRPDSAPLEARVIGPFKGSPLPLRHIRIKGYPREYFVSEGMSRIKTVHTVVYFFMDGNVRRTLPSNDESAPSYMLLPDLGVRLHFGYNIDAPDVMWRLSSCKS